MPYIDLHPGTPVFHCIAAEYARLPDGTVRPTQDVAVLNDYDRDPAGKGEFRFWTQGGGKYIGESADTVREERLRHILSADAYFRQVRTIPPQIYRMNVAVETRLVSVSEATSTAHCLAQLVALAAPISFNEATIVSDLLAVDDYRISQHFANAIGRNGHSGLEWPSVARTGGRAMFVFNLLAMISDEYFPSDLLELGQP